MLVTSDPVRAIADAVLYEGYMLYPYRASALKNRQRWTLGTIFPVSAAASRHGDPVEMSSECLLKAEAGAKFGATLRFLQIVTRERPSTLVPALQEAMTREVSCSPVPLTELVESARTFRFDFPQEIASEHEGELRRTVPVSGIVVLTAEYAGENLFKLRLRVQNTSAIPVIDAADRPKAQLYGLASAHLLLALENGEFVSLLDPPPELSDYARQCRNQGWWPVLVGDEAARNMMLVAPMILYDFPKIAPESPGDLFDGGEIDEILTLRILTLTDAEKREIAVSDPRVAAVLARTEGLGPQDLSRLHGTFRPMGEFPNPVLVSLGTGSNQIRTGQRVRLNPKPGGDIMDLALAGKIAVIETIERDFEDRVHVAVTLESDPGRDLGQRRFPGHRFFFACDEIEMLDPGSGG
jgi:hydrogenase maturation protease